MKILAPIVLLALTACTSIPEPSPEPSEKLGTLQAPLLNDDNNCGAEGYACLNGRSCVDSKCLPAWQPISATDAPSGRFAAAAIDFQGKYVITGGCTFAGYGDASTDAYAYDPATDSWQQLASLNEGRAYHTAMNVEYGTFVYAGLKTCNDTSTADLGFEKMADLGDTSWFSIPRNWTADYNVTAVHVDTDDILIVGGEETTSTVFEVREGSPNTYGSWSEPYCRPSYNNTPPWPPFDACGRKHPISFFENDIENRPVVRIVGGDPDFGAAGYADMTLDIWSHSWSDQVPNLNAPAYASTMHDIGSPYLTHISVGPRQTDDGRRVYVMDTDGSVHIYDRNTSTWTTDAPTLPEGFCSEGVPAWVNGELIQFSGMCDSTIATGGFRYQPPAP